MAQTIRRIRPLRVLAIQAIYDLLASQCRHTDDISLLAGTVDALGYDLIHASPALHIPELFLKDPLVLVQTLLVLPEEYLQQSLLVISGFTAQICGTSGFSISKAVAGMLYPMLDVIESSRQISKPVRMIFRAVANTISSRLRSCDDREALVAVDGLASRAYSLLTSIEGMSFIYADCLRLRALTGRLHVPLELLSTLASHRMVSGEVWGFIHLISIYLQLLIADGKFPRKELLDFVIRLLETALSCSLVGEEEEEIVGVFVMTIGPHAQERLKGCLYAAAHRLCNRSDVCGPLLLQAASSIIQLVETVSSFL